jgi:hypothetical protein
MNAWKAHLLGDDGKRVGGKLDQMACCIHTHGIESDSYYPDFRLIRTAIDAPKKNTYTFGRRRYATEATASDDTNRGAEKFKRIR